VNKYEYITVFQFFWDTLYFRDQANFKPISSQARPKSRWAKSYALMQQQRVWLRKHYLDTGIKVLKPRRH